MLEGAEKIEDDGFSRSLVVGTEIVEVYYRYLADGTLDIINAWVKTR
jgi:hypothetical protein